MFTLVVGQDLMKGKKFCNVKLKSMYSRCTGAVPGSRVKIMWPCTLTCFFLLFISVHLKLSHTSLTENQESLPQLTNLSVLTLCYLAKAKQRDLRDVNNIGERAFACRMHWVTDKVSTIIEQGFTNYLHFSLGNIFKMHEVR